MMTPTTLDEALVVIAQLRAELDEHTGVCARQACGKRFPRLKRQKYCSVSCGRLASGSFSDTDEAGRTCALPGCEVTFQLSRPSDPKQFCCHEHSSKSKTKAPEERTPRKRRSANPRPAPVKRAPVPELPPPPPVQREERPLWRPASWGPAPTGDAS